VDTLGLILAVVVHSVGVQDYHGARLVRMRLHGARLVRMRLLGRFPRLSFFWADGGYDKGALSDWAARFLGRALSGPRAFWAARFVGWVLLSAGSSCRLGPLVGWVLQIVPKLEGQTRGTERLRRAATPLGRGAHLWVVEPTFGWWSPPLGGGAHLWVVEPTFAWRGKLRRLFKDFEEREQSSEAWIRIAMIHIAMIHIAMIHIAMIHIMSRRLTVSCPEG